MRMMLARDRTGVIDCLAREATSGDEDALVRLLTVKSPDKSLNLGPADNVVGSVLLRLDVDSRQAERVLVDDAIHPAVTAATDAAGSLLHSAVPHGHKNVENSLLEQARRRSSQPRRQLRPNVSAQAGDTRVDLLHRLEVRISRVHGANTRSHRAASRSLWIILAGYGASELR